MVEELAQTKKIPAVRLDALRNIQSTYPFAKTVSEKFPKFLPYIDNLSFKYYNFIRTAEMPRLNGISARSILYVR